MWKYTVEVNGMMCGMCEAHVNDAVRKACPVKKVNSSRSKNQTVVLSETELGSCKPNNIYFNDLDNPGMSPSYVGKLVSYKVAGTGKATRGINVKLI